MNPKRIVVAVTTDGSGNAEGYSEVLSGPIHLAKYTKTDFANGVDLTITLESTGETIWQESDVNASKTIAPRRPLHTTAAASALYAAGGEAVLGHIVAAHERIKVAIAQGGSAKTGTFTFVVG